MEVAEEGRGEELFSSPVLRNFMGDRRGGQRGMGK